MKNLISNLMSYNQNAPSKAPSGDDGSPAFTLRERAEYYRRQAAYCRELVADYTRRIPEMEAEAAKNDRLAADFDEAAKALGRKMA